MMNRILCLAIVCFVLTHTGMGQPIKRFGGKIGVTSATWKWNLAGKRIGGIDRRVGLDVGAFAEWINIPVVSLLSEVHFIQKGMREDIPFTTAQFPDGTGQFSRTNIRDDYLSIALMPKFRFATELGEAYAIAGVRFDISIGNRVSIEVDAPYQSTSALMAQGYQSLVDRFRTIQFGGTFGVGAQSSALLPFTVGVEFRYSPNLQPALDEQLMDISNTSFEFLVIISN